MPNLHLCFLQSKDKYNNNINDFFLEHFHVKQNPQSFLLIIMTWILKIWLITLVFYFFRAYNSIDLDVIFYRIISHMKYITGQINTSLQEDCNSEILKVKLRALFLSQISWAISIPSKLLNKTSSFFPFTILSILLWNHKNYHKQNRGWINNSEFLLAYLLFL